jgi:hybrid cluster-associated redox disulfide protein
MIDKKMTILEILKLVPDAYHILEGFGMKCSECMAVAEEDLETCAWRHNVDLKELIARLNELS